MKHAWSRGLAALVLAGSAYSTAVSALPVTMTFEGAPNVIPSTPYSESGFTLTDSNPFSADGIFNAAGTSPFPANTNGTQIFGWCALCDPSQTITLARTGGGAFDFNSFDTAVLELGNGNNEIDVVGHFLGGGSITTSVTQTQTWATVVLNYLNVTSVDFLFGANHVNFPDHAIDNLVMDARVPEPGSLALLALGVVGAGATSRRRA